ncbi:Multidrug resistance efflux pump [Pseudoxanthomonas sp. GM95]|uniref:HlyD family secretion protein n=1 Tax=Pseudoxanthomonas sp. GM95 TaxID=1881043 RepID=UPI0008CAD51A|nr:HlyD family efflux transporter periplasmic adaptor subunit [Pseudoxanthomonas sp. GM95]SEM16032.1 Multidrug resistance efflux pump [Pseudoxanthomonas sp. GM95]
MIRRAELIAAGTLVALTIAMPAHAVIALTGEVRAVDAQSVYVPRANISPVVIRYFVPEGTAVKKGDVVLRLDPGQSATKAKEAEVQIDQARAKADKEIADLEVKALQAELEQAKADAKLADAKVEAALPKALISGLDYDRYQGELARATEEAALKRGDAVTAREAVARRRSDAQLEVHKLEIDRDYAIWSASNAEVRAQRDGIVVHGFNAGWLGGRIDEGSSAMVGAEAGQVVSGGAMQVRAWVLEADRPGLRENQRVALDFDALPGQHGGGRIVRIAGAPEARGEWGRGRYFQVDIEMDAAAARQRLLPGMSVRVIPSADKETAR